MVERRDTHWAQGFAPAATSSGRPEAPLFIWPGWHNLRGTLWLAVLFFTLFYTVAGATSFITSLHSWRLPLYTEFELTIPFLAPWALVYLSINLMFLAALFILPSWQELLPLFATLVAELLFAALFFLLLPLQDGFAQPEASGSFQAFFALADTLNLSHNYLPSLHVTFAFTLALAYSSRGGKVASVLFVGWAIAISLSTLLIHQHHLIDIVAGIVLAITAMKWVYPRASSHAFIAKIEQKITGRLSERE